LQTLVAVLTDCQGYENKVSQCDRSNICSLSHLTLMYFSFDANPTTRHSAISVVIGGFFYWTSLLCVNQATVQKAMSLKSLEKAQFALTVAIFGLVSVFLVNFYIGLMAFAQYEDCDPMKSGQIDAIDQLMPFYVMDQFGHIKFFVGIFVAG
jgi:solute carrier family 5 (sodium-coupled monocarboxylate transporter), member 8/12